jgi:hypothetical protein
MKNGAAPLTHAQIELKLRRIAAEAQVSHCSRIAPRGARTRKVKLSDKTSLELNDYGRLKDHRSSCTLELPF